MAFSLGGKREEEGEDNQPGSGDRSLRTRSSDELSATLSGLCTQCHAIGFDDILSHPERIESIGGKEILLEWTPMTCSLCQLLLTIRPSITTSGSQNNSTCSLFAFSSRRVFDIGAGLTVQKSIHDIVLLGLIPRPLPPGTDRPHRKKFRSLKATGFIAPLRSPRFKAAPGFQVRRVGPKIDWNILRGWLSFCERTHGQHNEMSGVPLPNQIPDCKVIDCYSRRIIVAPEECDYMALSYVWGPPDLETQLLPPNKCPSLLPEILPNTIEDAVDVVKQLGYRYLWVDRYCIGQGLDEKHEQIQNMDLIYRGAKATIIAAAGTDPTYGLPGVGQRLRDAHPHANIGSHLLLSTLPDPWESTKSSKWKTRAWTYQEAIFSRRRLIFTDRQAYFECDDMQYYEAVDMDPESSQQRIQWPDVGVGITYARFKDLHLGESVLRSHIKEYSGLSLTYESDILNGIQGIFRACRRLPVPIYHYWGIPVRSDHDPAKKKNGLKTRFLQGLTWKLSKASRRRAGFPSWSWTGWTGSVDLLRFYMHPDDSIAVRVFYPERNEWDSIEERIMENTSHQDLSSDIQIEAWTVDIRFSYLSDPSTPLEERFEVDSSAHLACLVNSEVQRNAYSRLVLCKEVEEGEEFHRRLQTESWRCIVLSEENNGAHFLLVLDGKGSKAEKVGYVALRRFKSGQKEQLSALTDEEVPGHTRTRRIITLK